MKYIVEIVNKNTYWYKFTTDLNNLVLHRENGPAVEYANGEKQWHKEGNLHREDGPAVEHPKGTKEWYKEDKRHREDGPAVEHSNGDKIWYKEGECHRDDGPAVEYANGTKEWYKEGKEFNALTCTPTCASKIVEFDGKKYRLIPIE